MEIVAVHAREILDSRGNPTIEVDVRTAYGFGRAAAPSGASTGAAEAVELRDGDPKRYGGKGVRKAIENVNGPIAKALCGMDVTNQREIDALLIELDGTEQKSKLGANAIVATSMAVAKAAADSFGMPLYKYLGGAQACVIPIPMFNILNGGKHAGTSLAIQEFMVMPLYAKTFSEGLRMGAEIYHILGKKLKAKYGVAAKNVGDEGGYAPPITNTKDALDVIESAIEEAGYTKEVFLCIDSASTSFYEKGSYHIDGKKLDRNQLIDFYRDLVKTYRIVSLEDPFEEEDFEGFAQLTRAIGSQVQIVGDDLLVTNLTRLQKAIDMGAVNALLLKVNQIGTITEAFAAGTKALTHGYGVVVSHRSGETEDTTIADIAVALGAGQIKTGAPARSERCAKYNQLLRIEEELGTQAVYGTEHIRRYAKRR